MRLFGCWDQEKLTDDSTETTDGSRFGTKPFEMQTKKGWDDDEGR
jgi:hypothetical protein